MSVLTVIAAVIAIVLLASHPAVVVGMVLGFLFWLYVIDPVNERRNRR